MSQYNVIVTGAGPGGYIAALRCAELGLKTAVVEKDQLGGVCLNVGCIPSKSLLKNAEVARTLRQDAKTFGFSPIADIPDFAAAVARSRKISKRLNQGIAFLMRQHQVDILPGSAHFLNAHEIMVNENRYQADHFIIAAGASPVELRGMESDGVKILHYRHAILQETCPQSVVIIGGGAIGVEFATIWNAYGAKVTIVEMQDHLLPNEDAEIGAELQKQFKKQGIQAFCQSRLTGIDKNEHGVVVHVDTPNGAVALEAEQTLIAVGFRANTSDLALEAANVQSSERGWIATDAFGQTNIPSIYAIGDVTGKILLAHAASDMGRIAAEQIAGRNPRPFHPDWIPHATYCHPQIASCGLTEQTAAEKGVALTIGKAGFIANGKALGSNENDGWAKLMFDTNNGALVGAALIGPEVSELLPELTLAGRHGLTAQDLIENVHAHPTLSEIISEAADDALRKG